MQEKVKRGYNKAVAAYAQGRDQFQNNVYLNKLHSLLQPNSKVLDLGCGSGRPVAQFMVEHGHSVVGLDISKEQIKLAKKFVPTGIFEVKDMSRLEPKEYTVAAVVSFYAIFHTPREQHQQLFETINTFLPTGGFLLVSMGAFEWEGSEEFYGVEMHWSQYGKETNTKIVREAGFTILLDEIDTSGDEQHQILLARKDSSLNG